MTGLYPGFKHVKTFGEDGDYEEETEESYVVLDLGTDVDKALLPNTSEYRLIGLDTPTPMLQLSGLFFKGTHEQLIGTEMLFTDGRDDTNPSRRFVIPVGTTETRIQFHQVEIYPKNQEPSEEAMGDSPDILQKSRTKARTQSRGKSKRLRKSQGEPIQAMLQEYGETMADLNTQQKEDV